MSEPTATAPKCPTCGAPLELLPDGTCRWCHAVVGTTATGDMALADLFFRLSDQWRNGWSLGAAPGTKHAIPWDFATHLLSPAREMLTVLESGVGQPGMQAIAASKGKSPDLDFEFCLLMNTVISSGIEVDVHDSPPTYLEMCALLDALATYKGTDPAWAATATDCAASARARFGPAWLAAVEGDDPDPFQRELLAWIGEHTPHADGERHHFWRH